MARQLPLFSQFAQPDQSEPMNPNSASGVRESSHPADGVCVIGSGSGGNCAAVRGEDGLWMIDLGFGPRTTATRLAGRGHTLDEIRAVCLTHLDRDHYRPTWAKVLQDLKIPLVLHRWHVPKLLTLPGGAGLKRAGLIRELHENETAWTSRAGWGVQHVRLRHDEQGTTGYRLTTPSGLAVGYATDLGFVPPELVRLFAGVDVMLIESNHDPQMTINSPRPSFVNRRNLSESGHLSNAQAFAAVQAVKHASHHGGPRRVVLLHQSSQCNHPTKVRRVFEQDPTLRGKVVQAQQRRATRWFSPTPRRAVVRAQLPLSAK